MNFFKRTVITAIVLSMCISTHAIAQVAQREDISSTEPAAAGASLLQSVGMQSDQYQMEQMMMFDELYANRGLPGGRRKVFIIPSTQMKKEDYIAVERDVHIMSHILDQVLKKPQMIGGVFTVMDDFFGRDSHVTEVIYLDGYGVLFFMEVNLVLTGSSGLPKEEETKQPEEHADAIWKRAELELYSPQDLGDYRENRPEQAYDAEKVEVLKKDLIEALKHAANVRSLKSDDSVILTIIGRTGEPKRNSRRRPQWVFEGGKWRATGASMSAFLPAASLTIRAEKKDIDAFSKGEKDFDAFYGLTQVIIH